MRRREFILLGGAAAAWPVAARAQQADMRRLGVLSNIAESDLEAQAMAAALHRGLRELGWVHGRNIQIDYRWGAGNPGRIETFANDLIALKPEVIVAHTTPAVLALRTKTDTIPLVFVQISDPIGSGLVANLANPGGNVTGFTNFEASMVGKWVEMLKEMAPATVRIAFLFNPRTAPMWDGIIKSRCRLLRGRWGPRLYLVPCGMLEKLKTWWVSLGAAPVAV